MKILVADDDVVSRRRLETLLLKWGHEVASVGNGTDAWDALHAEGAPALAILDWMMPGLDGVEVCRRVRGRVPPVPVYLVLLTARTERQDTIDGLEAGADDYLVKPFDPAELRARVAVGVRVIQLQLELARRVAELEQALAHVDQLHGILPICSYCKKIRSDGDSWQQVEAYVTAHSAARFSHGVCPDCVGKLRAAPDVAVGSKGTRVLIVDDEEVMRQLTREILEEEGYTALEAASGDEALERARAHPGTIDLLLTDIVMPNMGGKELAERLGRLCPDLKVLFMSGYTDDAIVGRGGLPPGSGFIQKPFGPASLLTKIEEVLR
jgi:DNA-binding response OmpR family regulator